MIEYGNWKIQESQTKREKLLIRIVSIQERLLNNRELKISNLENKIKQIIILLKQNIEKSDQFKNSLLKRTEEIEKREKKLIKNNLDINNDQYPEFNKKIELKWSLKNGLIQFENENKIEEKDILIREENQINLEGEEDILDEELEDEEITEIINKSINKKNKEKEDPIGLNDINIQRINENKKEIFQFDILENLPLRWSFILNLLMFVLIIQLWGTGGRVY